MAKAKQEIELERIKLQQQEQINLQNELRAKYSLDQKGENNFAFKIPGFSYPFFPTLNNFILLLC